MFPTRLSSYLGIERALAPGIEQIDGFFAFTHLSCLGRVHVDAIGAAVDLRRPYLHEFDQARFETALVDAFAQRQHRLQVGCGGSEGVESGFHRHVILRSALPRSGKLALMTSQLSRL